MLRTATRAEIRAKLELLADPQAGNGDEIRSMQDSFLFPPPDTPGELVPTRTPES
jgi:hypothetical protein